MVNTEMISKSKYVVIKRKNIIILKCYLGQINQNKYE